MRYVPPKRPSVSYGRIIVAMFDTPLFLSSLLYHSEQVTVAWQPQSRSGMYDKRNSNIKTCMTEAHLADVRQEDGCFIIVILIGTDRRSLVLIILVKLSHGSRYECQPCSSRSTMLIMAV
jgi:hypothetical protein